MTQTNWSAERKRLYRQARHQVIIEMVVRQYSSFDADGNWVGEDRPHDIKQYWASLTDTERAFEILQNTDAALFMQFYERIERDIPKPHIAP